MSSSCLCKSYGICGFQSKNALLCLTWNFAIFFIINSFYVTGLIYHTCALVICFAGCPLAGWLADVYIGRYQFIHHSLIITWSGIIATNVYYLIDEHFFKFPSAAETSLQVVLTIVIGLGLAGIFANSMQFGLDQLIDDSSTDICSFISLCVWLYFLAFNVAEFSQHYLCGIYDLPLSFLLVSLTITVVVLSDVACNHWLVKEPVTQNPLKLIYQVLRYAVKNKYPRMRSAFTYWEDKPYSRIDLGKRKYGGPFTTEQVEDVKTFFRVFAMLVFNVITMAIINGQAIISDDTLTHYQGTMSVKQCKLIALLQYFNSWIQQRLVEYISIVFIFLFVPLWEFLLSTLRKAYFSRFSMAIFNRINASIFLMLLSNVFHLTFELIAIRGIKHHNITCQFFPSSQDISNDQRLALNYRWLVIPQVIMGISQYLFYTGGIEFLFSQCPYAMRGLIIGAACITCGTSYSLYNLSLQLVKWFNGSKDGYCGMWYYLAYVLILLLMFLCFLLITKKCYKYRRRDEDIHNKQMFAENYYDKYLPLFS